MLKINPQRFLPDEMPVHFISTKNVETVFENERINTVLPRLLGKYRRLVIVSERGKQVKGVITSLDALDYLGAGKKHEYFKKAKRPFDAYIKKIATLDFHFLTHKHTIGYALKHKRKHWKSAHPVLKNKKLHGFVTDHDLIKALDFGSKLGVKVKDVMVEKVFTVKETENIYHVARMMLMGKYRRIPVADKGVLLGIVTPKDILAYLVRNNTYLKKKEYIPVSNIMNKSVCSVSPEDDIVKVIRMIQKTGIGGFPVAEDRELLGIITERDIVDILGY